MNIRDYRGRFTVKMSRTRKVLLVFLVLGQVVIWGGLWTDHYEFARDWFGGELVYKAEAMEIVTPDKVAEMKNDVLDRLGKCENPKNKPIVFDTNGVASVGQFQWQPHSFQHYWEKMTGEKIGEKEAVIYALDDEKARQLASFVIFDTDKGPGKDWVNCTRWHDLETLVGFIKKHSK